MSDASSSSDDEPYLNFDSSNDDLEWLDLPVHIRPKNSEYFAITIPQYSEVEFVEHFRLKRELTEELAKRFKASKYYNYQAGGNGKLNEMQHMLVFLWFAGHQIASYRDVADRFNIMISTLYVVIQRMVYFISNLSDEVIQWPSETEKGVIERHFRLNGFPGVLGAIDGSHIQIDKPHNDPDSYLNRKHYFSIQFCIYDLIVFTLEDNGDTLYTLLKETDILKPNHKCGRFAIYNPYNIHIPPIYRAITELNIPIKLSLDVGYYWISKEKALEFDITYPDNVYMGEVDQSYIPLIISFWTHKFEGAENYLSIFIEMNGACGLFLKDNDKLICWILRNHWGMLTVLETLPEYKRLGYASLMTRVMSKKIAHEGNNPLCTIVNGNLASQRMFTKLGFERLTDATYIEL